MKKNVFVPLVALVLVVIGFFASCGKDLNGDDELGDLINDGDALSAASCEFVESGFGTQGSVSVNAEVVANGLEVPWGIGFLPNGDMLVTERPGRIRRVAGGQLQPGALATIDVGEDGEGGLLGIAVHPDFAANRFFYVYYTVDKAAGAVNRVERYRLSDDSATATPDRIIIDDIPAGTFHNGGRLRFGPDGNLYVGTGDARDPNLAQDLSSTAGKILRLAPDGGIPGDNPTAGSPVFISGIRNTQGFDWLNGQTLAVTDHGPTGELGRRGGDEVSIASAGDNLGWPTIWQCGEGAGEAPLLSWDTATPPGGAAIYTGDAIPEWQGDLIIGTLGSEHLHRVEFTEEDGAVGLGANEVYLQGTHGRLRDVVNGPDGFLYVTTSNCDGRGDCPPTGDAILRIRPGT